MEDRVVYLRADWCILVKICMRVALQCVSHLRGWTGWRAVLDGTVCLVRVDCCRAGQRGSGGGVLRRVCRAAVTADIRTHSLAGGGLLVEEEVQLLAEAVEGEAHHIEEVPVDGLYEHAPQGLDTVAPRFVPGRPTSQ